MAPPAAVRPEGQLEFIFIIADVPECMQYMQINVVHDEFVDIHALIYYCDHALQASSV